MSIDRTVLVILEYRLSLIELVGIISSVASVYYAANLNKLTWSTGLVSEGAFFWIFYQVQLYSDMLLQLFFAGITLYGWYQWRDGGLKDARVGSLSKRNASLSLMAIALGTLALGLLMSRIHVFAPSVFLHPAASPYQDAFTAIASVVATVLLARRVIENWILWISVDLVSIPLYFTRAIPFMALLYLIFLGMATRGLILWLQRRADEARPGLR